MMADAAVCGFEMVRGDGTKVEGLVKEKQEAKQDYEKAISEGYTAGLGQQETGDVFSITVGNVSPRETVTINLRYVQPLMDDEKKDQIKFIFPRTYARRYGSAPSINAAFARTAHQPFQMDFMIQQAGAIRSISAIFASVSLTDRTGFLTQDIVLVITAAGLDAPRCFIEPHQSPNEETTAMALTFVPQFNLPRPMQGTGIQLVREALVVLLRGLPTSGTTFNIFSFGSTATKLSMQANYGGTEIASALQLVYDSLPKPLQRPVAVFLLTDGSAWDVSTCVENTLAARLAVSQPNNPKSYIRVFTVGIGSGASTDTCDSIARAGEGMAVYVKEGEPITGKCARLVRAARTPLVKVEVEWGVGSERGVQTNESGKVDIDDDFEMVEGPSTTSSADPPKPAPGPINLFGSDSTADNQLPTGPPPKPNPTLPPLPLIQQSPPTDIPSILLERERRYTQFFVLPKVKNLWIRRSKRSRSRENTHSQLRFLRYSRLAPTKQGDDTQNSELKAAYLEKDIIRLGTQYNLASRYTSFVAVDRSSKAQWASPALQPEAVVHAYSRAKSAKRAPASKARDYAAGGMANAPMQQMQMLQMNPLSSLQVRSLPPAAPTPPPSGMPLFGAMMSSRSAGPSTPRQHRLSLLGLLNVTGRDHSERDRERDSKSRWMSSGAAPYIPSPSSFRLPPHCHCQTPAMARKLPTQRYASESPREGTRASLATPLSSDVEEFARRVESSLG
ncbi:hypothetical protein BDP27DRAFT_1324616 [Rhodocollybia butyracea]|uniref:VIT domain-containing protein n=1 Tax=Rhodocollybia butyracea TaxID=206335 RepID=A0A9P5U7L5_9AGAR|nr:hypothetical protein BDP27DRAFT_1324616 [Rhodocollybia butyracea]